MSSATAPVESRWSTRKGIRGSSLLLLGKLPTKGINFLVQVLTAHYLSKGDFGAFAYAVSIAAMAETVVTFGLNRAVTRYIPIFHEQGEHGRIFGTLLLVIGTILGLSLLGVSTLYIGYDWIGESLGERTLALLAIMIFLAPLQALDKTLVSVLAVFGAAKHILIRKHVLGPTLQLGVVLLVIFGDYGVFGMAHGLLVAAALGIAIYLGVLRRILGEQGVLGNFDRRRIRVPARDLLTFTIPLLTTDLLYVVIATLDVVMLEHYHDASLVANLRVVQPLAHINQMVMSSFGILFVPMAARLFARGDHDGINHYYWQTAVCVAVFSLPVFLLTFSCAGPLTVLIYGERYADSGVILALLAIGYYFNAALGFNGATLKVYRRLRFIVAINLGAMLVALIGNWLLIPEYGALGAAAATCATLVAHNVLRQIGLWLHTDIDPLERKHLRIYGYVLVAALAVLLPQLVWEVPAIVCMGLSAVLSLLVLRRSRHQLALAETFPEVARLPVLRSLLAP